MRMGRRGWLLAIAAMVIVVAGFFTRGWYYTRYVWPQEIQREVLGRPLAPPGALIDYEGFSHYGQGTHQWRYKVDVTTKEITVLCGGQTKDRCVFSRSSELSEDVTLSVSYEAGILTVEEDWS